MITTKKYTTLLLAAAGLTLIPASGVFAQEDLGLAAPSAQLSGSDFFTRATSDVRWSVYGIFASSLSTSGDDDYDVAGLGLTLSSFVDENKELFAGFSILTGEYTVEGYYSNSEFDVYRYDFFAGFNYWFEVNEALSFGLGAKIGLSNVVLEDAGSGSEVDSATPAFAGINAVGLYKLTENMNLRAGIEANSFLLALSGSKWYEDWGPSQQLQFSAGVEFKF